MISALSIGKFHESNTYIWIHKTYSYIKISDLSIHLVNRHLSSQEFSLLTEYPPDETYNPVKVNKHLLGSLFQQQNIQDIKP